METFAEKFERYKTTKDTRIDSIFLLNNIKEKMSDLEVLLKYDGEDAIYRFYHHSFKIYDLQERTMAIVKLFESLLPLPLNDWFIRIIRDGTGKTWKTEDNSVENWLDIAGKIVSAFFHARYFLVQIVKYGKELQEPPQMLPSGWAAVLYLYDIR